MREIKFQIQVGVTDHKIKSQYNSTVKLTLSTTYGSENAQKKVLDYVESLLEGEHSVTLETSDSRKKEEL